MSESDEGAPPLLVPPPLHQPLITLNLMSTHDNEIGVGSAVSLSCCILVQPCRKRLELGQLFPSAAASWFNLAEINWSWISCFPHSCILGVQGCGDQH